MRKLSKLLLCASAALAGAGTAWAQDDSGEEEIVVTATRSAEAILDVPAAVSTVTTEQLEQQGFRAGADEFRAVPGVSFRRAGGDNDDFLFVNFRGVTGNHGNDFIAGRVVTVGLAAVRRQLT
jgi:outer membrane receptor protein involved in Fe transport